MKTIPRNPTSSGAGQEGFNIPLAMDYYKGCHDLMLPKGITKSVSYCIPRSSRIPGVDKVVFFGLQRTVQRIDEWFKEFFEDTGRMQIARYDAVMEATFGKGNYDVQKWHKLRNLGYLPLEFSALEEGSIVDMKTPIFCITNTHPEFAWLPQFIESLLSAETWHMLVVATMSKMFRDLADEYWMKTCGTNGFNALSLFSFRGEESYDGAVASACAWASSFRPCATAPAALELCEYYDAPIEDTIIGSPSTEHAVMCSNFAVDGNEITMLRRLLTEIYPNTSFSAVLDSYDYWNMVDNVLPVLKPEIMAHNGCFLVRGDSGDPVEVVTQTVEHLWNIFGGTVNEKGYKVLDPHVKAIYGDSITYDRCKQIYEWLDEHGYAVCNVALGVGSFSTQALCKDGEMHIFTRDTFNLAMKAQYIEVEGKGYKIFKSPKVNGQHGETTEYFKKSPKGCVAVIREPDGYFIADNLTWVEACNNRNELKPIYRDGKFIRRTTLKEVRERLEAEHVV